jgi:tRNA-specific 2-thiouridylase
VLYEDDDVLGGGWIHEVGNEADDRAEAASEMPA